MDNKDYEQQSKGDIEIPENPEFRARIDIRYSCRILNPDQLDALRLDAQSASPERQAEIQEYAVLANQLILAKYGKYIAHSYSDDEVREKILVVSQEESLLFNQAYNSSDYDEKEDLSYDSAAGRAYPHQRLIVLKDVDYSSTDMLETLKDIYGKEKDPKELDKLYYLEILIHELVHLYHVPVQPRSLYNWLNEAGAFYYERVIMPVSVESFRPQFADFYQRLIDKFGDRVTKFYFAEPEKRDRTNMSSYLNQEYRAAWLEDPQLKEAFNNYGKK